MTGDDGNVGALRDRLALALRTGQPMDLRAGPEETRRIDGEEFRDLLVSADPKTTHALGLHVAGLIVVDEVDLSYCTIERPLELFDARFDGPLRLGRLQIPALDITGSTIADVWAPSLAVKYSLSLEDTTISGQLWLVGAQVGGDLLLDGIRVNHELARKQPRSSEHTPAVTVFGARINGSWTMRRAHITGLLRMSNAVMGGDVRIADCTIEQVPDADVAAGAGLPQPALVEARRTQFGADVTFRDVTVDGEVFMPSCAVAGVLDFAGSVVGVPGTDRLPGSFEGDGLTLDGATVGGDLLLADGFRARGPLRLVDTAVGGSLHLQQCALTARKPDRESALMAVGTTVSETLTLRDIRLNGGLTLYGASADLLDDGVHKIDGEVYRGVWHVATTLNLRDLQYRRFGSNSSTDVGDRTAWLEGLPTYDDSAWRQLGEVYLAQGQEDQARRVAIAAQDERRRRTLKGIRRLGRWVLGVTISHGYRPGRAVVIAAACVALLTLVLQLFPQGITAASTSTALPYKAAYALDVFLPIIDLGLADGWKVTGLVQWACWATILTGWALSTLLVAAFSRVVRNP